MPPAAPEATDPNPPVTTLLGRLGALRALASFRGKYRILHMTVLAFFFTFVVWFDYAPFAKQIGSDLGLDKAELTTLTLCNLALTVPCRIIVGMLLDRFGPRRVYSGILMFAAIPNTAFALSSTFPELVASRLLVGITGAGFVVGIRMTSEWFDKHEIGTAEGFYGGWGNFGSAAAAFTLPTVGALIAGGPDAWRWGIGLTGILAGVYGLVYWFAVSDTPDGSTYVRPHRQGALEVTSRGGVFGLLALQIPPVAVLGLVAYRIEKVGVISPTVLGVVIGALAALYAYQAWRTVAVNGRALSGGYAPAERYPFRSVALLSLGYFVTFGTELTVVSLLPTFFSDTFGLGVAAAGAAGSAFAFTNLVTRPAGGLLSDSLPRRRTALTILLCGACLIFIVLSQLDAHWPLWAGVALVALASVFIQGGNGAVFAVVPLVNRRVSGQVAGMAGAYGNIGGLVFTSILAFGLGGTTVVFLTISGCAAAMAAASFLLPEPTGDSGSTQAVAAETPATPDRVPAPAPV